MFIQVFICAAIILAISSCQPADQNSLQPTRRDSVVERKNTSNDKSETSPTPERKDSAKAIARLPEKWRLSLKTSGGIAGLGAGNLTVESSGAVVFERRVRPAAQIKTCRTDLSAVETRGLRDLLAEWRTPVEKSSSKPNVPAPDAFAYSLEIYSGAGDSLAASEWFDNTYEDLLPPDKILIETLSALREKVRRECGGESNVN